MRILRFGEKGQERPGILDGDGQIRDLSSVVSDFGPDQLADGLLERLARIDLTTLPVVEGDVRIGCPLSRVPKIVGFGTNYKSMATEKGIAAPTYPLMFFKPDSSLNGPDDTIVLPSADSETIWEVELAVVIGKPTKNVTRAEALSHVAGYVLANDVTDTRFADHFSQQWWRGKIYDTFTPLGPWLVTADEIPNPDEVDLRLHHNDKKWQDNCTSDMIFDVAYLISHASEFFTLVPGDVILTGSPAGVGKHWTPPVFLQPGDTLDLGSSLLGRQKPKVSGAWIS